jgi:plastocyanin
VATDNAVQPGASQVIELPTPPPGDHPFVCTLHQGMEGTLRVVG